MAITSWTVQWKRNASKQRTRSQFAEPRQPQRSVESQCLSVQRNTKTRTMLKRLVLLLVCEVSLYNLVTSARVCGRPPQVRGARVQDEMQVYEPGQEIIYQCNPGYRMTAGSRKIICKATGTWPSPTMKCSPKLCSYPGSLVNGHVLFSSLEFQTTVNFTCLEGYILHGHNDSECQHDSTWSNPLPVCKPVTCGLPEIPKYGLIKHHTKLTGNTTYFGDTVQYECSSPYVLFGNEFGSCSANGNWTETPECKLVTCPPPTDIENGFMSFAILRNHGYGEKIRYGCKPNYVLDGSMEIQCEKTGHWSTKPVCRASCIISAKRARIFYNGQKIWVEDLPASRVQHADMVAFYCKDKDRACGYPVLTQCVDGNLIIPSCYKEPNVFTYNVNSRNLPSEIKQC